MSKFQSVIIDTVNQLQTDAYVKHMADKGKPTFDVYRNFGVDVLNLYMFLKSIPNAMLVQVIGGEGTGKTVGASFLNPDETYFFNCDRKPLSFYGAKNMYSTEKKNYYEPKDYADLIDVIGKMNTNGVFKKPVIFFLLGHTESYKFGEGQKVALRFVGAMAHKLNIEGGLIHSYYTEIDPIREANDPLKWQLRVVTNNGQDTCRSPHRMWENDTIDGNYKTIPNNFQLVANKIIADY